MPQPDISADTEVILLLCGRFGGERQEAFAPLQPREYTELAQWLQARSLRPADLLHATGQTALRDGTELRIERARLDSLLGRGTALALARERWARGGVWVLSRGDAAFPKRWKRLLRQSAPPLLYGAGDPALLERGGLAIIGSRDASPAALDFVHRLATRCAAEGIGVVSGGARGVDVAAMQGVTEAGGEGLGVLACDLLKACVNRQNRAGLQQGRLVLVSPYHPEAGFNAGNAMARNRCIYTLADRALVIDTALHSGGTWAGALENLKHGWVPLYVRHPGEGAGNAALIELGAIAFPRSADQRDPDLNTYFSTTFSTTFSAAVSSASPPAVTTDASASPAAATDAPAPTPASPAAVMTSPPEPAASHDMLPLFLNCLDTLLQAGPLGEELIAQALNLEKAQVRVWLKQACTLGRIEKLGKPVRYALNRQAQLC